MFCGQRPVGVRPNSESRPNSLRVDENLELAGIPCASQGFVAIRQ